MFCHAITTACLAFAFLITRSRFLVIVSSKGTTNGYTYKRQYNYSQHVHEYPASRGFSLVFLSVVLPCSSLFWLLAFCFGCFCAEEKNLCRQPFGVPVEHARDENAVTMEFLGHVSVIRCRRRSLPVSFTFSHLWFLTLHDQPN